MRSNTRGQLDGLPPFGLVLFFGVGTIIGFELDPWQVGATTLLFGVAGGLIGLTGWIVLKEAIVRTFNLDLPGE